MGNLWRDLKYGLRVVASNPGFTAVAVVTLALGIAANTTIFTVVDGVLLRPLAYDQPDRIVGFWGEGSWASGELAFMREQSEAYEQVAAFAVGDLALSGRDEPLSVTGAVVSTNIFSLLGIQPALGRGFLPEEEEPGKARVAVLSDGLWRRVFGADPNVVGQTVVLDDMSFEVVGVMPPHFRFPSREAALWFPLEMDPDDSGYRRSFYLGLVGRLRPGVSLGQAQAELATIVPRLQKEFGLPDGFDKLATPPAVMSFQDQVAGDLRPTLLVLLAAVGLVLLIACANVANLLLARAADRHREMAIRCALGARRMAIVRQLLAESTILALLGGGLGMLVSVWGVDALVSSLPASSPRVEEIGVDLRVLIFCLGLSLLTVLVFGLAPALRASKAGLSASLAEGGRSMMRGSRRRTREALVVAEVGLAVMLVIAAGLLTRSFFELTRVDPGFSSSNVLSLRVNLASQEYADRGSRLVYYEQVLEQLGALPGVQEVGGNWRLPVADLGAFQTLEVEGQPVASDEPFRSVYWRAITGDYFQAMGMPLLVGRAFSAVDRADLLQVCVINQSMSERYWPEGNAVGKRLKTGLDGSRWITIVGVVGDVKHNGLGEGVQPLLYRPYSQSPGWMRNLSLVVRSSLEPESLARSARGAVWSVDPNVPVFRVESMGQILSDSISSERLTAILTGLFGLLALVLAAIGVFGVLSFMVSQRKNEIGIRMALGASRREVLRLVLREGMTLALVGVGLGVLGAIALTRFLSGMLFGVSPTDPLTYAAVLALLTGVAFVACYLPGRRAASVDPIVALRYE